MPVAESEYWRERRKWGYAHTELFTKGKFITGPIIGIVAFLLQWWLGLRVGAATFQFIATLIVAYFAVAIVQLIANWIYYAPVALERERLNEIELKDRELLTLKAVSAAPRFHTVLKHVGMTFRPNERTTFHATVEIRNLSGEKTTLHDLTLSCLYGPPMVLTNPDRRYFLVSAEALESGVAREGNLAFVALTGIEPQQAEALKGSRWQFSFRDVRNQLYASDICELKYP
jgi:hypothetical protein